MKWPRGERVGGGEKRGSGARMKSTCAETGRRRGRSSSGAQAGNGKNEEEQCILGNKE